MKILFINPNYPNIVDSLNKRILTTNRRHVPLDLLYPATVIKNEGYDVKIVDANINHYPFGKLREILQIEKPDFTFINTSPLDRWQCPYLNISPSIKVAELAKSLNSKVAMIGPHGTITPDWLFNKNKAIDFIIRGEPDLICLDLIRNIKNLRKVRGISYKLDDKIKHNEDAQPIKNLDSLPIPNYSILPIKKYQVGMMVTSRGCPYNCTFCLKKMYYGSLYRTRSPENVIKEIKSLLSYGINHIYFFDMEFTADNDRVNKICDLIIKENLNFKWACSGRLGSVSEELLTKLKKAGCYKIDYGIESGSQKILDQSNKRLNLAQMEKMLRFSKKLGIINEHFALFALPGETLETINEHLDFIIKLDLSYHSYGGNLPIPYPGTILNSIGQKQFNKEITWDNCILYSGRIGTDILQKLKDPVMDVSKIYLKRKYGRYYFLNPKFYIKSYYLFFRYLLRIFRNLKFKSIKNTFNN